MADCAEDIHLGAVGRIDPEIFVVRVRGVRIMAADALELAVAQKFTRNMCDLRIDRTNTEGMAHVTVDRLNTLAAFFRRIVTSQAERRNAAVRLLGPGIQVFFVRVNGKDEIVFFRSMQRMTTGTFQSIVSTGGQRDRRDETAHDCYQQ